MNRMIHFTQLAALIGFLAVGAQAAETVSETFDLSFPGGSLAELIRTMETASGKKLNVLLPQDGASYSVPKLELRAVTAENVFRALNNSVFREQLVAFGNEQGVYVLMRAPEGRRTKVFYVGHLLGKLKIEDITTAIQTTWEFGSKESNAKLKYHEDTRLLIVLADNSRLETAAEVLRELERALEPSPQASLRDKPGKETKIGAKP